MKTSKFKFALLSITIALGVTALSVYSCEKENITPEPLSDVEVEQSVSELKLTIADPEQTCGAISERYLKTNSGKKVGKVFYYNDAKSFYVQLMTIRGYFLTNSFMHICNSTKGFPLNDQGNPAVNEFKYSITGGPLTNVQKFVIPIRDLEGKSFVAIASNVKLLRQGEEKLNNQEIGNIIRIWADGSPFGENKLGRMFVYEKTECSLSNDHFVNEKN
jgi:hypothetical protein